MSIHFRCIFLAQPPLDQGEIQQVEKLISIYTNEDVDAMETVSTSDSMDVKVYTLEDDVQPEPGTKEMSNQMVPIWREVPGSCNGNYFT